MGALIGITAVHTMARLQLGAGDSMFLTGSFGAAAVLLYAAPQSELAQPRNLLGGQILSALIGVCLYKYVPWEWLTPGLAVATAIFAMHATKTLHPPGGATALIAVIGGDSVHALGFMYVLVPVALGSLVLLLIALAVNNLSSEGHYPLRW